MRSNRGLQRNSIARTARAACNNTFRSKRDLLSKPKAFAASTTSGAKTAFGAGTKFGVSLQLAQRAVARSNGGLALAYFVLL